MGIMLRGGICLPVTPVHPTTHQITLSFKTYNFFIPANQGIIGLFDSMKVSSMAIDFPWNFCVTTSFVKVFAIVFHSVTMKL